MWINYVTKHAVSLADILPLPPPPPHSSPILMKESEDWSSFLFMLFFFEGGSSLSPRLGASVVPLFRALSGFFFFFFLSLHWICFNITPVFCFDFLAARHVGSYLPDHGSNPPHPTLPALEGEILATGPPGKSLLASFKCTLCLFTLTSCFPIKCLGNRIHFATFLEDRLSTEVGIGERGAFQARGAFRHLFQLVLTLVCHTQSYVRVVICIYRNETPPLPPKFCF